MVSSTLKVCVPLVLAMAALAGCGKQGDENASTPPPAPASTAAAPSPAMPAPGESAAKPATPAYPQSSPAPATTTH
jgi:hypothetical protein